MTDKRMHAILRPARRGSKRGWFPVTGELPPDQWERLVRYVEETGRRRTDIVAEAVIEYLDRKAA